MPTINKRRQHDWICTNKSPDRINTWLDAPTKPLPNTHGAAIDERRHAGPLPKLRASDIVPQSVRAQRPATGEATGHLCRVQPAPNRPHVQRATLARQTPRNSSCGADHRAINDAAASVNHPGRKSSLKTPLNASSHLSLLPLRRPPQARPRVFWGFPTTYAIGMLSQPRGRKASSAMSASTPYRLSAPHGLVRALQCRGFRRC